MRSIHAAGLALAGMAAAGCVTTYAPQSFAAPAPASALECVLRSASGRGYGPVQGGLRDGYMVFHRPRRTTVSESIRTWPANLKYGDGDRMVATTADGELRVTVSAYAQDETGAHEDTDSAPTEQAFADAQEIVTGCAVQVAVTVDTVRS